jgi:epoxyqueuosine reductase QueG
MESAEVKQFARQSGADLVGIADLELLSGIHTEPADLLEPYTRAVVMAVRLSDGVMDGIDNQPTPLYQQHYYKVNAFLDDLALRVSRRLQAAGAKALPIPASQLLNSEEYYSYLSHKAVALAAGLGWQGKSLLLVTREFGPRVRLVTVLTDMDLAADQPVKNLCGQCTACTDACPAGAIKNVNTDYHYHSREEALDFRRCVGKITEEFQQLPFIDSPICGVCIRSCIWGRKGSRPKS